MGAAARALPPAARRPDRLRGAVESFLVLRRNPLELWGEPAYRLKAASGRFLGRAQLLLNAPDAVRHVLLDNAANYQRTPATRRVLRPLLGDGVFLAEGEAWRGQRRVLAPAFAPRTLPILARHVAQGADQLVQRLSGLCFRPLDLLPHLQGVALEIAGQSMFSLQMAGFGAELRGLLGEYGTGLAQPGIADLLLPEAAPGPQSRARAAFRARWLDLLDRILAARGDAPPGEGAERDLLDLLRAARDPETGAAIPQARLRDEVSTLLLAGHETTATTLFWALWLAAFAPDWQEEMAAEARAQGWGAAEAPGAEGPKLAATLAALPRIRAHVDEALRLYPPAFLIVREAMEDDPALAAITGLPASAGTTVIISPFVVHRHRQLWPAPDEFRPERFLPGATPPARFAYLPFGAGPRICIGAQFALTEAVLVLARLLSAFAVRFAGPSAVAPRGVVTTQPDRIVRFELMPRRG